MTRLRIRIEFDHGDALGPGKVRLLELIEKEGSIRKAAVAMKVSYRQAWLLVHAVEDTFGAPVIATATGGSGGGGASLTELGRSVLEAYRAIEKRAEKAVADDLVALTKFALPPRRKIAR